MVAIQVPSEVGKVRTRRSLTKLFIFGRGPIPTFQSMTSECIDNRAVTPVIGIILLVALAVILGAIIGAFALGLGDRVQDYAPSTSMDFDYDTGARGNPCGFTGGGPDQGKLTISHTNGDRIQESQLTIVDDDGNEATWNACSSTNVSEITGGDKTIPEIDSDDTIRLVWVSENDDDDTSVVAKYEGPDA